MPIRGQRANQEVAANKFYCFNPARQFVWSLLLLFVCFRFYVRDSFFIFLIHLFTDFSLFIRRVYLTVSTLQHVVNLVIKSRSPSARLRRITLSQSDPASRLHHVSQDGTTLIAVSVCLPAEVNVWSGLRLPDLWNLQAAGVCGPAFPRNPALWRNLLFETRDKLSRDSITAECLFSLRLPGPSTCPLLKPRERFQSLFWYLPYVTSQRADSPNVTFSTHVLKGWTTRAESGWNSFFF